MRQLVANGSYIVCGNNHYTISSNSREGGFFLYGSGPTLKKCGGVTHRLFSRILGCSFAFGLLTPPLKMAKIPLFVRFPLRLTSRECDCHNLCGEGAELGVASDWRLIGCDFLNKHSRN